MKIQVALVALLLSLAGCKGDESKTKSEPPAAGDKASAASATEPVRPAKAEPAAETTEGRIEATIGGETMTFSYLPAASNYALKTNMGIQGFTEPGGASLQIMSMHRVPDPTETYPMELRSATSEEQQKMLEEHQKALKAGKQSRIGAMPSVSLIYKAKDGSELFDLKFVLKVESFDGAKLKGSFAATLKPKRAKDGAEPVEVTDGELEVVLKTPAAGRAVEKAAVGQ